MPSIRCLLLGALLADAASAQATFTDGFEGNLVRFDAPPGVWDFIGLQFPNQSMVTEAAAVKRGVLGLRAIDSHRDAGSDSQVVLGRNVTGSGNQYTRVWWRVSASNGVPSTISFLMTQGNTSVGTLAETKWNPATNDVGLVCFDRNSMFFNPPSATTIVPDGGFHLIELALLNVGTNAAQCSYAVDGQERARQIFDQTGTQFGNVLVGPVYGESEWTGVMDYDDFAASSAPIASRVDIVPTTLAVGACERMTLRTLSSFSNQPAPVATQTTVDVTVDGGDLFSDDSCLVPQSPTFIFPPGSSSRTVRLRGTVRGALTVTFVSDDLVSSTQLLVIFRPDAGAVDAGVVDAGTVDAGTVDAGMVDAGMVDAGTVDAGTVDAGTIDAGTTADAGLEPDAGVDGGAAPDAGVSRDGGADAGVGSDGGPAVDAGVSPESNDYAVGCGCSSGAGSLGVFMLLLLLTKRRA